MLLSVIVVSHGHEAMLGECLSSLLASLDGIEFELLIVDNLPGRGIEDIVRPLHAGARVIKNASPVGLAENMNRAAAKATGRYMLLLNPDTAYVSGSFQAAIDYVETRPDVAVLGCRMLNPDGSRQISYRRFPTLPVIAGRALAMDHWPYRLRCYRSRMMQEVTIDRPTEVDWVFGAFMLMRREQFRGIGGMDTRFRLYYEDVDLCYRARLQGLKTIYYPDLCFVHRHMRTSASRPLGQAWRWHLASAFRFLHKHSYWLGDFTAA
jgi:GT2 family glycosyltransferase